MAELCCGRSWQRTSTEDSIKLAVVDTSVGVCQRVPSSWLLLVSYVDKMVKMMKRTVATVEFLGSLHTLLLMDDAVVLATPREMC